MARSKNTNESVFKKLIKDFTNSEYSYDSVLLQNKNTREVWILAIHKDYNYYDVYKFVKKRGNPFKVFYWNGSKFSKDPLFTYYPYNEYDEGCIKKITTKPFDNIVVYWSGKHSYHIIQQYSQYVIWYIGKYFHSQDSSFIDETYLFTCKKKQSVSNLLNLIISNLPQSFKLIDPFYNKKRGILIRDYGFVEHSYGVFENRIVIMHLSLDGLDYPSTFKIYSSQTEAVEKFKFLELDCIKKSGRMPNNFYFINSFDNLKKEMIVTPKDKNSK